MVLLRLEAHGDAVIARQIDVDDAVAARRWRRILFRRHELHDLSRDVARLDQEEPADLRHMRAGGDVDVIVLGVRIEGIGGGEVVHRAIDLLEIPGVFQLHRVEAHLGLGRDAGDVAAQVLRNPGKALAVDQLQAADKEILVLAERHGRPPALPAVLLFSHVERRAEKADHDAFASHRVYPNL